MNVFVYSIFIYKQVQCPIEVTQFLIGSIVAFNDDDVIMI
jgi:hypothetical protein